MEDLRATSHEPEGYRCPFCALIAGTPMDAPIAADVVAERERAVAFISPRWWARNPRHVIVVPRTHVENLYDITSPDLHGVMDLVQEVARGMRGSYGCSGVSTRQHNEPDGDQDVWHLHVHVFPRYPDDRLYETRPLDVFVPSEERASFARRLRTVLGTRMGS
ncbi:HIT family protein [Labedella endophytica]|uniref:HIT family protein n=1 Tax=Labedella endophytica TaxID=1523160 RepID=UPI001FB6BC33|nr:HIT family protein [Labedella endophytica]